MASTTQDDGFHEIQLNGKQLVFLFMAVTVVSVVIFLSGVLVGRGVRTRPRRPRRRGGRRRRSTGERAAAASGRVGATRRSPTSRASAHPACWETSPRPRRPLREGDEPSAKPEPVPESPPPALERRAERRRRPADAKPAPAAPAAAAAIPRRPRGAVRAGGQGAGDSAVRVPRSQGRRRAGQPPDLDGLHGLRRAAQLRARRRCSGCASASSRNGVKPTPWPRA